MGLSSHLGEVKLFIFDILKEFIQEMIWSVKVHLQVQHDPKRIGTSLAKFDVRLASRSFGDGYHRESCRQLGRKIVLHDEDPPEIQGQLPQRSSDGLLEFSPEGSTLNLEDWISYHLSPYHGPSANSPFQSLKSELVAYLRRRSSSNLICAVQIEFLRGILFSIMAASAALPLVGIPTNGVLSSQSESVRGHGSSDQASGSGVRELRSSAGQPSSHGSLQSLEGACRQSCSP